PALILFICLTGVHAMAADGLITVRSNHDPNKTVNRLEAEVKAKGLAVFAPVDHAAGAGGGGGPPPGTQPFVFGGAPAHTALRRWESISRSRSLSGRIKRAPRGCPTTIRVGLRSGTGSAMTPSRPSMR